MKKPNYAPVYCALYPAIAELCRKHGYAVAIHGTLARDMDIICIPWISSISDSKDVVKAITNEFAVKVVGEPEIKEHGREVWTLSLAFDECFIDLSFTPNCRAIKRVHRCQIDDIKVSNMRQFFNDRLLDIYHDTTNDDVVEDNEEWFYNFSLRVKEIEDEEIRLEFAKKCLVLRDLILYNPEGSYGKMKKDFETTLYRLIEETKKSKKVLRKSNKLLNR